MSEESSSVSYYGWGPYGWIPEPEKDNSDAPRGLGDGCFGCLTEIIGLLGIVYIVTHWGEIWSFVLGK
jgi:hypothetical protein